MSYSDAPTDAPTDARPVRPHGWTVDKQQAFLDALAGHGRVVEAAAAVGMSAASAYRLRARVPAFAFGWRAATALAYERLRDLALDRATNGVVTPRFYHGAVVSETVRYSDRLLLGLLAHLKPEAGTDPATGKRRAAAAASELWAAAVDAYDTARETGAAPVKPHEAEDGPRPKLSREEMIALVLDKLERATARDEPEALDTPADPQPSTLWGAGTIPPGMMPDSVTGELIKLSPECDPGVTLAPGPAPLTGADPAGDPYGWPCPPPAP